MMELHPLETPPELAWIALPELYVEESYQRSTSSKASVKNLEQMTQHFSWRYCGALVVSPGDKKGYAVLDGQHRLLAARARGDIDALPCIITARGDVRAQAQDFVAINTRRVTLNTLAKFHAAVAAGDADAVSVLTLLAEVDIHIPRAGRVKGETAPRELQCVGTIIGLLGTHTKAQIQMAVSVIPEAYGDLKGQLRAGPIKALATLIQGREAIDRAVLLTVLMDLDLCELEQQARNYVKINGGRSVDAMVTLLERHYSKAERRATRDGRE